MTQRRHCRVASSPSTSLLLFAPGHTEAEVRGHSRESQSLVTGLLAKRNSCFQLALRPSLEMSP